MCRGKVNRPTVIFRALRLKRKYITIIVRGVGLGKTGDGQYPSDSAQRRCPRDIRSVAVFVDDARTLMNGTCVHARVAVCECACACVCHKC